MTISVIKGSDNINYNLRDDVHTWGGRNLLKNSNFIYGMAHWNLWTSSVTSVPEADSQFGTCLRYYAENLYPFMQTFTADTSEFYCLSYWIKTATAVTAKVGMGKISPEGYQYSQDINVSLSANKWTRVFFILYLDGSLGDTNIEIFPLQNASSNAYIEGYFANFKLEKGNKPTDWSPSPEDIAYVNGTELVLLS